MPEIPEMHQWSQYLQRRVVRLLLLHDGPLFYRKFRTFLTETAIAQVPLLQQYDLYIKLRTMCGELLDDILPRITRQLTLKTTQTMLQEDAPTRGEIDWPRTIEETLATFPGQPPVTFVTRLRNRSYRTPENLLMVAILQRVQAELQRVRQELQGDEALTRTERQFLAQSEEVLAKELSAPFSLGLRAEAAGVSLPLLISDVQAHLRPGPNPYRDLLAWWERFTRFRFGRMAQPEKALALTSERQDEKVDAWLYELWIVLELLNLLHEEGALLTPSVRLSDEQMQCLFCWNGRQFRLWYNRQLDTVTSYEAIWDHAPPTRPDYVIERAEPLEVRHQGRLIWREPPVLLDAKYYSGDQAADTHLPIKKLLGDMTLLGAKVGALFFPMLAEPEEPQQVTRTLRPGESRYVADREQCVHLYRLVPTMPVAQLKERLRAVLDMATAQLPERPAPCCQGVRLDPDTVNASAYRTPGRLILCRKAHIGDEVFDLVDAEVDCLRNPRVCHVIGQAIVPPVVMRSLTDEQLMEKIRDFRQSNAARLKEALLQGDEEKAERIRDHILGVVGQAVEQYVGIFGDTSDIDENFKRWIFGEYWKTNRNCLSEESRKSLVSGEYVWRMLQGVTLPDWTAPAIQFCRCLEMELKRRFYYPCENDYTLGRSGFTLGTLGFFYRNRQKAGKNWETCCRRVRASGGDLAAFEAVVQRMIQERVSENRNKLAHEGTVERHVAESLRDSIIGSRAHPGLLLWFVQNVNVGS
uniref:DUF2357 domain-containing protein n=1 Tax=Thermosporothrix sp. COM3 TaxID=2490863 RepID=A0A455SCX4_9CHLR|nr:hypothetical protein KTC_10540 [Thermosporothrix sp. COM3]